MKVPLRFGSLTPRVSSDRSKTSDPRKINVPDWERGRKKKKGQTIE
jgi:hypothetical protein